MRAAPSFFARTWAQSRWTSDGPNLARNLTLARGGDLFTDQLALAMIDRIVRRVDVISLNGVSCRPLSASSRACNGQLHWVAVPLDRSARTRPNPHELFTR